MDGCLGFGPTEVLTALVESLQRVMRNGFLLTASMTEGRGLCPFLCFLHEEKKNAIYADHVRPSWSSTNA
jgi:hypothetical protein